MKTYQEARFSFGKARSFAPIIIGMKKFPITAGIDGMRKRKSITTPCRERPVVASSVRMAPVGVIRLRRTIPAAIPPTTKNTVIEIRYRMPIRLWSVVRSHDQMPYWLR